MDLSLKIVDHGWDSLMELRGQRLAAKSGVIGTKAVAFHRGEALTNAELFLLHEFGSANGLTPERAPMRKAFDANRERYVQLYTRVARAIYDRKIAIRQGLEVLGMAAASDVRELIRTSLPPPNSPLTIARKGSSTTLVDSAQMINSVSSMVVSGAAVDDK